MGEWNVSDGELYKLGEPQQVLGKEAVQKLAAPFGTSKAPGADEKRSKVFNFLKHLVQERWSALVACGNHSVRALAFDLACTYCHATRIRYGLGPEPSNKQPARQLRHSFIILEDESLGPVTVVDPYFRDQFQLGATDSEYSSFLHSKVPEVFVGSPQEMGRMLHAICREMHAALKRQEMSIPPWRQTEAVLSKWVPLFFCDEHLGRNSANQAGDSAATALAAGTAEKIPVHVTYGNSNCTLLQQLKQQRVLPGRSAPIVKRDFGSPVQQQAVPKVFIGFDVPQQTSPPDTPQHNLFYQASLSEESSISTGSGYSSSSSSSSSSLSASAVGGLLVPQAAATLDNIQPATHEPRSLPETAKACSTSDSVHAPVLRSLSIAVLLAEPQHEASRQMMQA